MLAVIRMGSKADWNSLATGYKMGKHKSINLLKICVKDKNQDGEMMHVLRCVVSREIQVDKSFCIAANNL